MKKKFSLLTLLVVLLMAFSVTACSKGAKPNFGDYEYNGEVAYEMMTIDEGISIDGELTEDIWANCQNTLTSTSTVTPYYDADTQTFKWMDVHTYFGENGIYVAFEVYDNGIYFSKERRQTRNTGVELYFSAIDNSRLNTDAMSLRVAPNGDTLNPLVSFWRGNGSDYSEAESLGDYIAAAKINGTLNKRAADGSEDDEGYVVELAISYDLFGGPVDIYHYTASFIQMANANDDIRYANTFISGTTHTGVGNWKAVTNDGVVSDKYSYIDRTVTWDEEVEMDGKLTEDFWVNAIENDKGKDWTYTARNLTLNIYTYFTDMGIYIGLDCNDKDVYYNPNRVAKYNTGAEVFVVPMGQTTIGVDAKQVRFNVGGGGERWVGAATANPWTSGYFKAKTAGSVKGEGATINSSNTEGWQGEIYIPWAELNVTSNKDKTQIAIQTNVYHSPSDEQWENINSNAQANAAGWEYVAPNAAFNTQVNPQEEFFLFTEDGFSFNAITARDASLDTTNFMSGADILLNNADIEGITNEKDYYYVDTVAKVNDGGVKLSRGYTTTKSSNLNGTFVAVDESAVAYEHLGDGNFRLYFEKSAETLEGFATDKEIVYTNNGGGKKVFKVSYDANMAVNGTLNASDSIVFPIMEELETKAIIIDNSFAGTNVYNGFSAVTDEKGLYGLSLIIKDPSSGALAPQEAIYYFSVGEIEDGLIRVAVNLATGEKNVMRYGYVWESAPDLDEFIYVGVGTQLPTGDLFDGEEGYVVEFKILWNALDLDGVARDFVKVSPAIRFSEVDIVLGQNYEIHDEDPIDLMNYVRFGAEGFAPDTIYAQKSVLFVYDEAIAEGSSYAQEIDFSYLGHGGLISDTTATIEMAKETVEAITIAKTIKVEVNGINSEVTVDYVKPNASAFNANALAAYINFDHGAENLVGNAYTNYLVDNRSGSAFITDNDSYEGDKYFDANMNKRSVKVPMKFGSESFTVSMMIDGDALRNHVSGTYAFILFGTGNVDTKNQGFSVRARGDNFQIRTNNGEYFNLPFDMSKLDGWQRLTFTIQRVSGGASVYVFVGHELVLETNVLISGDVDVAEYGTLGIGGPGSFRDTETGYKDINIGIDDVIILKKYDILNKQALYNMLAYVENFNEDANFGISAGQFDYNFGHFANAGDRATNSVTITNNLSGEVTLGGAWSTIATLSGNTVSYEIDRAQAIALSEGESWYQVGEFKKYVNFTFAELSEIVLDKTHLSVWKTAKEGDRYILKITATSEGTGIVDGMGLTFKTGETMLDATHVGEGEWAIEVPALLIEALTEGTTLPIIASIDDRAEVAKETFLVEYKYLNVNQVAALAQNAEVMLDFENNSLTNKMTGANATMIHGSVAFDNGAYVANVGAKADNNASARNLVVPGVKLGTDSFTVSALINLSDLANNTKHNSDQGHATMLFGTRDVDGTGNDSGFSVLVKSDGTIQFRYGETKPGLGVGSWTNYGTGFARLTFIFDRETAGTVTFKTYINETMVATGTYSTNISFDYALNPNYQLGIGGGGIREIANPAGNRGTGNVRFGDFMLFRGVMNQTDIANMAFGIESYYDDVAIAGGWSVNDVNIAYEDVVENEATVMQLALTQIGATHAITDATITGLPEGVTVDNTGKLSVPYAKLNEFKNGATLTATISGVTRDFKVTYYPLEAIYTNVTEKAMWTDEKTGNNYVFTVKTFVDEAKTMSLGSAKLPLTFKIGSDAITANETSNAGEYTLTIPATMVEGQATKTITVSTGMTDVADATIAFTHKSLDSATLNKLVAGTQTYLSFEDSLKDIANESRVGTMVAGTATYEAGVDGKAIKLNPTSARVQLANVKLGTESFTMSFDVKTSGNCKNNNFELVSSLDMNGQTGGPYNDMNPSTLQVSHRGGDGRLRIAVGRNGEFVGSNNNMAQDKVVLGEWQRFTLVITRDIETVPGQTKTINAYDENGNYRREWDSNVSANGLSASIKGTFSTPEKAKLELYLDGALIETRDFFYSEDQYIGINDMLYLGGMYATQNYDFWMDNFVVYSGAMTADEVRGMTSVNSSYYAQIGETYGVDVADVLIDFNDAESAVENGVELDVLTFGKTDVTGATLVDAPAGVSIEANGSDYTLKFADQTALAQFKTTGTLTIKWGELVRTFTVTYTPLETLYVNDVKTYAFENNEGFITRDVKVTADEAGLVGVNDVTFGSGIEILKTPENNNGIYVLKIPFETATYEVGHSAVAETVEMNVTIDTTATTIVKDTEAPQNYNGSTTSNGSTQGGKVYNVGTDALNNGSFSLSVMVKDLDNTLSGGQTSFFTTSNTEAYKGFSFYANATQFRLKVPTGTAADGTSSNVSYGVTPLMEGWHHLLVTFDRSVAGSITYTVYVDGVRIGSATDTVAAENDDFDTSGHISVGAANGNYIGGGWTNQNSWNYSLAGVVITKGIIDVEAATQYVKYNVQDAIDAFESTNA